MYALCLCFFTLNYHILCDCYRNQRVVWKKRKSLPAERFASGISGGASGHILSHLRKSFIAALERNEFDDAVLTNSTSVGSSAAGRGRDGARRARDRRTIPTALTNTYALGCMILDLISVRPYRSKTITIISSVGFALPMNGPCSRAIDIVQIRLMSFMLPQVHL